MRTLTRAQILLLHRQLLETSGGRPGLRDGGLLDSALAAPFQSFAGRDLYPTIPAKAAQLCFGLVKNHPMADGNKRLGAHAMLVFLALNGYELAYTQQELSGIILALAAGDAGAADILQWILAHQI